jgi:hypothetical protein
MSSTGSNFTDWQRVEKESRLLIDEDFSWSEPPQRRRRRITASAVPSRRSAFEEPIRAERHTAVLEYEPEFEGAYEAYDGYQPAAAEAEQPWDPPTEVHSHFDEMMAEWNANHGSAAYGSAAYGSAAGREFDTPPERAFDLSDPGLQAPAQAGRRTVVITGHGDDRYLPAPRQRRASELRFHERSGFSPDRAGLWAVLLGIALVIGAIAH